MSASFSTETNTLNPIRMHPAYRHGDMTPWGGDGLGTLFHKDIPDDRTGEALEISAIPALESRDDHGEPLHHLIARHGEALVGKDSPFPLLLKLIAAREKLSVQVHPGDAYAGQHDGKLGKSEAWVILHAEEGAYILYGMKPGVDRAMLKEALAAGADIESMIRRVPVKAGDVFYIPSGMVHAIGGGIVLYEIQQSSDATYRLWDYGRLNDKGEPRELHIEKALDVIDPDLPGQRVSLPPADAAGVHRLLTVPAFALDAVCVKSELALAPCPESFRMLTALSGMALCWDSRQMELSPGTSVLLPVRCPPVTLKGEGLALMAAVR